MQPHFASDAHAVFHLVHSVFTMHQGLQAVLQIQYTAMEEDHKQQCFATDTFSLLFLHTLLQTLVKITAYFVSLDMASANIYLEEQL